MKKIFKKIITWILTIESQIVLWKYQPNIVGITGSVGKTTTKDAVTEALGRAFYVRGSAKSYNSEIGIPLAILDCDNAWGDAFLWFRNILSGCALIFLKNHYPKWLVLEVGIDTPGDMRRVTKWLSLDVAVITHLGSMPVHVAFFPSPEHLRKEKLEIVNALREDGTLVINGDDEEITKHLKDTKHKIISYGFSDGVHVRASNLETLYEDGLPVGINFKAEYMGNIVPIQVHGVLGRQHAYAVLAALAVAIAREVNIVKASEAFRNYETAAGRMRILKGINDSVVIDDSYNSSPAAADEALTTLASLETKGRKIAVLGDMSELGAHAEEAHRKVGEKAGSVADILVVVGKDAQYIADEAVTAGLKEKFVHRFDDSRKAGEFLKEIVEKRDIVLLKGSQNATRMERAVEKIMAEPEKKQKLLVRQDEEWGRR